MMMRPVLLKILMSVMGSFEAMYNWALAGLGYNEIVDLEAL